MNVMLSVLPSGLTVVTGAMAGFETAAVGAFVFTGARAESAANNGIAHFLEHMAFKGTASRSAYTIASEVERLGSAINAYTDYPVTAYYATGLKSAVGAHLSILADVLTHSVYDAADIAMESGVIVQEIKMYEDDPQAVAGNLYHMTAFPSQPLGRPILGRAETVCGFTQADFQGFVGTHYTAPNMVVVATGAVAHDEVVALCTDAFADLPTAAAPAPAAAAYQGGLGVIQTGRFEQVNLLLGWPTIPVIDARSYAYELLAIALGGSMSAPLFQEIRERRGLVYSVHAQAIAERDHGQFVIAAGTTAEHVPQTIEVACAEVLRATESIAAIDLERAKNQYLVGLARLVERPFSLAEHLARSLRNFGQLRLPATIAQQIGAVQLDDLRTAAQAIVRSSPTVALAGPVLADDYLGLVHGALA